MDIKKAIPKEFFAPLHSDEIPVPEGCVIPQEDPHDDTFTSVRRATYRDKEIEISTTYRIVIDGEVVRVHTTVLDDGTVHYHGFPQYSFPSALDLARKIVDGSDIQLPEDELGKTHRHQQGGK